MSILPWSWNLGTDCSFQFTDCTMTPRTILILSGLTRSASVMKKSCISTLHRTYLLDQDHKAVLVSPRGLVLTKWSHMAGDTEENIQLQSCSSGLWQSFEMKAVHMSLNTGSHIPNYMVFEMWKMSVKLSIVLLIYIYRVEWLNDELGRMWCKIMCWCVHSGMRTYEIWGSQSHMAEDLMCCWVCSPPKIDGITVLWNAVNYTPANTV